MKKTKTANLSEGPPRPLEDLAIGRDYLRMLRKSYVRLRTITSDLTAPYGITTTQFLTLLTISNNSGISQAALCLELDSDPNTVSQMIRRLEIRKLVARKRHPSDGRAVRLFITPGGNSVVNQVLPEIDRVSLRLHALLPKEGKEVIAEWLQALTSIRDLP